MSLLRSLFSSLLKDGKDPNLDLGVFGKHPGWDDHMDDFGIDTEELLSVKQLLYVQGVGGAIDSGLWENPTQGDCSLEFGHWFYWRSGSTSVLGRIWSSRDRKGRARYPLVLCVQFNRPLSPILAALLSPKLRALEEAFKGCEDPHEVVKLAEACRSTLKTEFVAHCSRDAADAESAASAPPACSVQEWMRLIFAMDSQLSRFGKKVSKDLSGLTARLVNNPGECEALRLPTQPLGALEAILYWNRFLDHWVAAEAACLTLLPDGAAWADILVGRPSPKTLFCLKAPPSILPLTSDIPFEFPDDFEARAKEKLGEIFSGSPEGVCTAAETESKE
jgi:hypothetical protein